MKYFGTKSLDAEIHIDFKSGEVRMDYSSNSVHDPYNSNTSAVVDETNKWYHLHWFKKNILIWVFASRLFWDCIIGLMMVTTTSLQRFNLFPSRLHYPYQNFLKHYFRLFHGTFHESFEGEMSGTILQVPIDRNIWMSYKLEGDYEKYISKISFERRIREFRKFDNYPLFVQDGWMLTFEFDQIPKQGSCKVVFV